MCATREQRALLRRLYPSAPWAEIEAAFPGVSRDTLYGWACRYKIPRLHRTRDTTGVDPLVATLVTARIARGIQPKVLAAMLGVSLNALYTWERGQCAPKDFRTLHAWANAVGMAIKLEPLS